MKAKTIIINEKAASHGDYTQTASLPGNLCKESVIVKGVNLNTLNRISNRLNSTPGFYNFALRSCSSVAARSLTLSGVPMLGLHPYLVQAQAYLWGCGVRPWSYCHFML